MFERTVDRRRSRLPRKVAAPSTPPRRPRRPAPRPPQEAQAPAEAPVEDLATPDWGNGVSAVALDAGAPLPDAEVPAVDDSVEPTPFRYAAQGLTLGDLRAFVAECDADADEVPEDQAIRAGVRDDGLLTFITHAQADEAPTGSLPGEIAARGVIGQPITVQPITVTINDQPDGPTADPRALLARAAFDEERRMRQSGASSRGR